MGHRWYYHRYETVETRLMEKHDQLALKASDLALMLRDCTQYEIGYLCGILAEREPVLAQQFVIALKLNLEDIYDKRYPIE
jgi:hypothetical protein